MTLFSYCLAHDGGGAPNPYYDVCTLVLCKGAIRRTAKVGDWIVGHGARENQRNIIYAMKVTEVMLMSEYDSYCQKNLREKIPDWESAVYKKRVGDCLYNFADPDSSNPALPSVRKGVHDERNREHDLCGKNALLSEHFYYFGKNAIELTKELRGIIHPRQGHQSRKNDPFADAFVKWIENLGYAKNKMHGEPREKPEKGCTLSPCAARDKKEEESDIHNARIKGCRS